MMPHCKRESQFELFEEIAAGDAAAAPKIALPFQRSAEVDMRRARKILGISGQTVQRMIRAGLLRGYPGIGGTRIEYQSIVAHCNDLRLQYHISAASSPRAAVGRQRDRDILPFPLDETIYTADAMVRLDCSKQAVLHLIEEGALVAYRVGASLGAGAPWRIHEKSLDRYLASLHAHLPARSKIAP